MASECPPISLGDPDASLEGKAGNSISQPHQSLGGGMATLDLSGSPTDVELHAIDMQQRCRKLLDELEEFQAYLRQQNKENSVELRTFKGGLQAEMKLLDKVSILHSERRR
jgi:hypothetical protein